MGSAVRTIDLPGPPPAAVPWARSERVTQRARRSVEERARTGDADAFAELYRTYRGDVLRLCRRMLGAGAPAEEAAAEAFLRARGSLDAFRADRPFRPWLLAIAGHHCIDLLRRRRRESTLFDASELSPDDLTDGGPSPLQHLLRSEERAAVLAAVDALPPRYRAPLVLRYFADLDYATIAELLEVAPGHVGALLFRARRRLREDLSDGGAG